MGDVEFERRVEEEAGKAWIAWCGSERAGRDRLTEAVRPLVERLAAAEGDRGDLSADAFDRLRAVLLASPTESTLAAAERVSKALAGAESALKSARYEHTIACDAGLQLAARVRELEARPDYEQTVSKLTDEIRALRHESSERLVRCGELESRVIAQDAEIRAAQDEARRAWVRVVAAEDITAAAQAALDEAGIVDVGQEPLLDRLNRMIADANFESDRTMAAEVKSEGLEGERDEALSMVRRYRVQLAEVVGRESALRSALADARAGLRALARDLLGVDVAGRRVEEVGS